MELIKVVNEQWFKTAPFEQVMMLGIKYFNIPAEKFENKQAEHFKRAMVRQVFVKGGHQYGEEFEIYIKPKVETNPFGKAKPSKKYVSNEHLSGTYSWVKSGLRAEENDIRHEMIKVIEHNSTIKDCISEWYGTHDKERYPTKGGKLTFSFEDMIKWAFKCGWILKTGD